MCAHTHTYYFTHILPPVMSSRQTFISSLRFPAFCFIVTYMCIMREKCNILPYVVHMTLSASPLSSVKYCCYMVLPSSPFFLISKSNLHLELCNSEVCCPLGHLQVSPNSCLSPYSDKLLYQQWRSLFDYSFVNCFPLLISQETDVTKSLLKYPLIISCFLLLLP